MAEPEVVSDAEWQRARGGLLAAEGGARALDALAGRRGGC